MNLDISSPIVVRLFEMAADVSLLFWIFGLDCIKMCLNPVHTPQLSLSHILHFASLASDAINQIWALAGYIFPSYITAACVSTGNAARPVEDCTIFTISRTTFIYLFIYLFIY